MTLDDLCKMARDAGVRGLSYNDFLHDDAIGDAFVALDEEHAFDNTTTGKIEAAFVEGRKEFRLANGWPVAWTTAPVEYDQFGTDNVEEHEWHHRTLRKVVMNPAHAVYQRSRYMSGAQVWDEDPRIVEAQIQQQIAKDRAEAEERAKRREEGLQWLRTADLNYTDEDIYDAELHRRRITWADYRAEQKRRREEEEATALAADWERCRSAFADGVTIVDPGCDARQTSSGTIPNREPAIHRSVRVVPHYARANDADEATVEDANHYVVGSLRRVADRLAAGEIRLALDEEHLPPQAVLARLKPMRLGDVVRVVVDERVLWVGCERFSRTPIVLDERAHLVRAKKTKSAAEQAFVAQRSELA